MTNKLNSLKIVILVQLGLLLTISNTFCSSGNDLDERVKKFIESCHYAYDKVPNRQSYYKDLSFINVRKFGLKRKNSEKKGVMSFYIYEFSNENESDTAYREILNCFGPACGSIVKNKNYKGYKISPTIFIFNRKSIIIAKTNCKNKELLEGSLREKIVEHLASSESDVLFAGCGGPLKWR
jgi:hypothetical protein